jgi:hypothetical protein
VALVAATALRNDLAARNGGSDTPLDFDLLQACSRGPTMPITRDTLRTEEQYVKVYPIGLLQRHHHISRLEPARMSRAHSILATIFHLRAFLLLHSFSRLYGGDSVS